MNVDDVKAVLGLPAEQPLPLTLNAEQMGRVHDNSADSWWKAARDGTSPVEPLHIGRAVKWPTAKVLATLGIDSVRDDEPAPTAGSPVSDLADAAKQRKDRRAG